jgi:hypothetical protein
LTGTIQFAQLLFFVKEENKFSAVDMPSEAIEIYEGSYHLGKNIKRSSPWHLRKKGYKNIWVCAVI